MADATQLRRAAQADAIRMEALHSAVTTNMPDEAYTSREPSRDSLTSHNMNYLVDPPSLTAIRPDPGSDEGPRSDSHIDTVSPTHQRWRNLFVFTRRSHLVCIAIALCSSITVAGLKIFMIIAIGRTFEVVTSFGAGLKTASDGLESVNRWCLILTICGAGAWLANATFMAAWIRFGELQAETARRELFAALLKREMAWFDLQESGIPSLMSRIESQVRHLQTANSQIFGVLVNNIMTSIAAFFVALSFSWKLTLLIVASLPIPTIAFSLLMRPIKPAVMLQKDALGQASKLAAAALTAIDVVTVFNGAAHEVRHYMAWIIRAAGFYRTQTRYNAAQAGFMQFWTPTLVGLCFLFGIYLVQHGNNTADIMITFYAMMTVLEGVQDLLPEWLQLVRGMSAGSDLKTLMEAAGDENEGSADPGFHPDLCTGHITVDNVSFKYPTTHGTFALQPESFRFEPSSLNFIVGRSGSGKSTLGNLLVKFYAPTSGSIFIDGHNLRALSTAWVRANVCLIQQNSLLFNDTFFKNIALGSLDPDAATIEDVRVACDMAVLQSTIHKMPEGMDTMLGSSGHNLSGGQKQRLALARARLRDPAVLILDEVTSGLDTMSKSLVMDALRTWRKGKTTIIITHDISQIERDDWVYVMDAGCVVQHGRYHDLSASSADGLLKAVHKEYDGQFSPNLSSPDTPKFESDLGSSADAAPLTNPIVPESPLPAAKRISRFVFKELEHAVAGSQLRRAMSQRNTIAITDAEDSVYLSLARAHDLYRNSFSAYGLESKDMPQRPRSIHHGSALKELSPFEQHTNIEDKQLQRLSPKRCNSRFSDGDEEQTYSEEEIERELEQMDLQFLASMGVSVQASRQDSGRTRRLHHIDIEKEDLFDSEEQRQGRISGINAQTKMRYKIGRHKKPKGHSAHSLDQHSNGAKPSPTISMRTIFSTIWPNINVKQRALLIVGLIMCAIAAAGTPTFSYCFAKLLATFWAPSDRTQRAAKWTAALVGIGFASGVSIMIGRCLCELVAQAWVNNLRHQALHNVLSQPVWWAGAMPQNSPRAVVNTLNRCAEEMCTLLGSFVLIVVVALTLVLISIIWALVLSPTLTLVCLTPAPAIMLSIRLFSHVSGKWEAVRDEAAAACSAVFSETFMDIRVVRALTLERHFDLKHRKMLDAALAVGVKRSNQTGFLFGMQQSMTFFLTALIFWYSMSIITKPSSSQSVSDVIQVINLLLFGITAGSTTLSTVPQISTTQSASAQVLRLVHLPVSDTEVKKQKQSVEKLLPIVFDRLAFSYPSRPNSRVLHSISFQLKPGSTTAIVGSSGSGKSTLIGLLMGLYEPEKANDSSPSLSFAGVPADQIRISSIHAQTAYVPQSPFLFPDTVLENILYGLPADSVFRNMPHAEMAAKAAGIHDFICSLPHGYQTLIGDGGQSLSGGQMQRVSIARALVRKPKLLVMDEPTSALDAESADLVRETIAGLMRGYGGAAARDMAIVIVTHNPEMMKVASDVVVIEEGYVAGQGSFEDLLSQKGEFWRLVQGGV
ncbi:Alpha-factor-transporting ATPase [Ceratocystis lukuohia]|uniref:Alpha-factor-transporting ATPase n=1 Tax=Ceratocystis lukuohia TaxID=2019550 RepID=A0ABR4MTN2_9PEZI